MIIFEFLALIAPLLFTVFHIIFWLSFSGYFIYKFVKMCKIVSRMDKCDTFTRENHKLKLILKSEEEDVLIAFGGFMLIFFMLLIIQLWSNA